MSPSNVKASWPPEFREYWEKWYERYANAESRQGSTEPE